MYINNRKRTTYFKQLAKRTILKDVTYGEPRVELLVMTIH
jgi:hypothetical protein